MAAAFALQLCYVGADRHDLISGKFLSLDMTTEKKLDQIKHVGAVPETKNEATINQLLVYDRGDEKSNHVTL